MENDSLYDYATPFYKVLTEPNLLFGVGLIPALIILVLTIVLIEVISFWCIFIGAFLYILVRLINKTDPYNLLIVLERILEPDIWRA